MLAGTLLAGAVMDFQSYITVNGIVRPHESWSVDREIAGDLPAQVVGGTSIRQATGSITWAQPTNVDGRVANPWNDSAGWTAKPGDRVIIWAGDGATFWKQFTGVIDKTEGDLDSPAKSSIIDDYDRLNVRFSHDALLRVMPPTVNGGVRRGVGLSPIYFIDACLRKAGFHITPPLEARPAVSVPAQGSMWPERGNVIAASDLTGGLSHAQFHTAPWGRAAGDFLVELGPITRLAPTEPVELTVMVAPEHSGNYSQNAFYGSTHIQLAVAGSRTAVARLNGVDVCSLVIGSSTIVALLVKSGTWTLRTNTGTTATGNATPTGTTPMDKVTLSGDGNTRVAGIQICYPATTTEFNPVNYTPGAVADLGTTGFISLMDASPVIKPTTARNILEAVARATLTPMWIDENGVGVVVPSDVLRSRASVAEVSTEDMVRSLSWQNSLLSLRSGVDVDFRRPFPDVRVYASKLLKQGSMQTLSSGQSSVELVSPGSDEDWIEPDLTFEILGTAGASANSNMGRGSITGAVVTDGTTESLGDSYLTASMEQISPGTIKVTHTAGSLPAGNELELRYPSSSSTIWPRWLKESFYFIRSFAANTWADMTQTSTIKGPSFAPVLVHDTGPWLARTDNTIVIDRVGDFLANQVTTPSPVITGLRVSYDPRRQLGDVLTVSSKNLLGVTLTVLVVRVSNTQGDRYEQVLDARLISASTTFTTYAAFADAHPDTLTYEQWRVLFPDTATYSTFNSDPLRGATL